MIAVFTKYERDFEQMNCSPKNEFRRIRRDSDVFGIKFKGVIAYHDWHQNKNITEAYDILKDRQPELFKR